MCHNVDKTLAAVMAAVEPELVQLLTIEGLANTEQGTAAINAFNAAQQALANWQPGSASTQVIELLNAFTSVLATVPIPPGVKTLAGVIVAAIAGIVQAIKEATTPTPPPGQTVTASTEEVVAASSEGSHARMRSAIAAVHPTYTYSMWHNAVWNEKKNWNTVVKEVSDTIDKKYAVLEQ